MIDLYCERAGPGLWAEPLNATTDKSEAVAELKDLSYIANPLD